MARKVPCILICTSTTVENKALQRFDRWLTAG